MLTRDKRGKQQTRCLLGQAGAASENGRTNQCTSVTSSSREVHSIGTVRQLGDHSACPLGSVVRHIGGRGRNADRVGQEGENDTEIV